MRGHFEGWYFKHQINGRTLAVIPGRSEGGAFIQIITDGGAYMASYPLNEYRRFGKFLYVGGSVFSPGGIRLNIGLPDITLKGSLYYGSLTPIKGDIMGPFRFLPMECRHSVVSMRHDVTGTVTLNGEALDFTGGSGYIEGDSGRSFPSGYSWVQCNLEGTRSVMAAAARIPFAELKLWGCIGVVMIGGHEYRLATYSGAKVIRCGENRLSIRQGRLGLDVAIEPGASHTLFAPDFGRMDRIVGERVSCPAHFRFVSGGRLLIDEKSMSASYEYAPEPLDFKASYTG